jgi:quercetin dioxygenase-like cupin family protein
MRIIKLSQVPKDPFYGPTPTIGVGTITSQPIVPEGASKNYLIKMVNFNKGARNKFHKHTCDQVLIITQGKGIVANEQGETRVEAGDIVHVQAGEKHWHGATKEDTFSHIYILSADNQTTQLED